MQNNFGTGAILNNPDNRDVHIIAAVGAPRVHPAKNITDMSAFAHENQLSHGTCVGQAEGKGDEFRDFRETGVVTRLSKRFIYTQCKLVDGYAGQGTQPRIAAQVLKEKGTPKAALVPDNNALPYEQYLDVAVTDAIRTDASTYRTKGYAFCYNLDDIKTAIDVAGVMNATMQVGTWYTLPVRPDVNNGYHRVMFFGYEDALNGSIPDTKIYFWNSWGDEWGDNGNGWFWYSEYAGYLFDLMVYTDMPNEVIDYTKKQQYIFTRDLEYGMYGTDVIELQKRLMTEPAKDGMPCFNPSVPVFLRFGPETRRAVGRYQEANRIVGQGGPGYGRCGPLTRKSLNTQSQSVITLVDAIIQVESGGNDYAVGDKNLTNHAYGSMQIRLPVCIDVNRALGTSYKPEDMLGNRELSIKVYNAYMALYATPQALGREVTDQDRARIWNGGPTGWKKTATIEYWSKVQKALAGQSVGVPLSEQVVAVANRD